LWLMIWLWRFWEEGGRMKWRRKGGGSCDCMFFLFLFLGGKKL
jgi:hypothetical protein